MSVSIIRCRHHPNEEGTETPALLVWLRFLFAVADIIPMKRELKRQVTNTPAGTIAALQTSSQ